MSAGKKLFKITFTRFLKYIKKLNKRFKNLFMTMTNKMFSYIELPD
jgi:hypothetical protein